jgi:hypothetical protein
MIQFIAETLVSLNKNCIFEHYREFQVRKTLLIDIIFAMKKISVDLFRAAQNMLMLVLHKDALLHCTLAYFATAVSYARKMFMKLTPGLEMPFSTGLEVLTSTSLISPTRPLLRAVFSLALLRHFQTFFLRHCSCRSNIN